MNEESAETVMEKALNILSSQLSRDEYLIYLEAIAPKVGNATKELHDETKALNLKSILSEAKKLQARG